MGMRSQVYIRYKNEKKLVAMHLQWNYGFYMINRTYQLLDYLKKNLSGSYSNFKEENYDIVNGHNEDVEILHNLIQMNLTMGSYVKGHDLVKEEKEYFNDSGGDKFKMTPKHQDNNNGILVIDIKEDGTIKYGLGAGGEDGGEFTDNGDFKMINAKTYFNLGENQKTGDYEKYRLENEDKELYNEVLSQINFIDNNFKLLTQEEYEEIFDKEYSYKERGM